MSWRVTDEVYHYYDHVLYIMDYLQFDTVFVAMTVIFVFFLFARALFIVSGLAGLFPYIFIEEVEETAEKVKNKNSEKPKRSSDDTVWFKPK